MIIKQQSIFTCNGKEFTSNEEAQEYCEELLTQALVKLFEKGCEVMSPKSRLKLLETVHRLTYEERRNYAQLFIVETESNY